jgi:DNA-binding transcriptional ArsR family regulator
MRVDLLIHPVRLRIIQALGQEHLTTQELAKRLADVPLSSLYRHLQLLRKGDVLDIVEERVVNGIVEKVYAITGRTFLSQEDMAQLTPAEHLKFFTTYVLTLIQGFARYVETAAGDEGTIDMAADYAGYNEIVFFANEDELYALQRAINEAFLPLVNNKASAGRRRFRMAFIAHPTGDQNE